MGINIADLPPEYQRQVLMQIGKIEKAKQSKYRNQKDERANIRFASKKEAHRYDELILLQKAGKIKDLKLQVDFTLQEGFTTTAGERIKPIKYKADFTYRRREETSDGTAWDYVVEDAKSRPTRTQKYLIKRKMVQDKYGIKIAEV